MTSGLPPNLLRLFAPRPPLPYIPPSDMDPAKRKRLRYTGIAKYIKEFGNDKEYQPTETADEKRKRLKQEKIDRIENLKINIASEWDPTKITQTDPYRTLFVSHIAYETTESQLRKTMEVFGDVSKIVLVKNRQNKPTGYAFVEFEREDDMKLAYKEADKTKLNNRRILVDVERGRTVQGWKPKKLGGGLGKIRTGPPPMVKEPEGPSRRSSQSGPPGRISGPPSARSVGPPSSRMSGPPSARSAGPPSSRISAQSGPLSRSISNRDHERGMRPPARANDRPRSRDRVPPRRDDRRDDRGPPRSRYEERGPSSRSYDDRRYRDRRDKSPDRRGR